MSEKFNAACAFEKSIIRAKEAKSAYYLFYQDENVNFKTGPFLTLKDIANYVDISLIDLKWMLKTGSKFQGMTLDLIDNSKFKKRAVEN